MNLEMVVAVSILMPLVGNASFDFEGFGYWDIEVSKLHALNLTP